MRLIKDYNDFYFNNKKLSEMGGEIINQYDATTNITPSLNIQTINIPGRDGEIPISDSYEAREWSLDIFFREMTDIRLISNWLSPRIETEFYYISDDVKIRAMILDVIETEISLGEKKDTFCGTLTLNFRAFDPYYYLLTPINHEFTTVGVKEFENDGNRPSEPFIKFTLIGTQNIKFKLNNITYEIESAKDYIEIDTKTRMIRDSIGMKRQHFKSEGKRVLKFPTLNVGKNTFELILGSVQRTVIRCNSNFI